MWKIYDVDRTKEYYLQLCENLNNHCRYFVLTEKNTNLNNPFVIFTTEIVPHELLLKRNLRIISETVKLSNGKSFSIDAHGVWLTEEETKAFSDGVCFDKTPWLNGTPPHFAPK